MIGPAVLLNLFVVAAVVAAGVVAFKPSLAAAGGRPFAFVVLFVLPALALAMGASEHLERSKGTKFCLSCHIMEDYGKSLYVDDRSHIPAVHFQNGLVPRNRACYTCHTDYAMYGDLKTKLRGMRHVYVQYLGSTPAKPHLYTPFSNRECLHCHRGSRSFEEAGPHTADPDTFVLIKSAQMSCLSSGCHETAHDIENLKGATLWKGIH